MVRDKGFDRVEYRFQSLLEDASWSGSGDDMTIGVISRFEREQMPNLDGLETEMHAPAPEKVT